MEMVLPSDSTPLSDAQYSKALEICEWAASLIRDRDQYIKDYHLDSTIANPSANWSKDSTVFSGYNVVGGGDRRSLDMLRLFTQVFTGNFLGVRHAAGMKTPTSVPPNLDADVAGCLSNDENPWWLQRHSKLIEVMPEFANLSLPIAFGESGFKVNGCAVLNHDLFVYLERLSLLKSAGVIERISNHRNGQSRWWRRRPQPVIIEIGSGFGGLAYLLRKVLPCSTYICVDLPESLCLAALYLSRFFPNLHLASRETSWKRLYKHDFVLVPNYMFHRLVGSGLAADLAINTLSMSEMSPNQVVSYCHGIRRMIGSRGVFFEQNQDNRSLGLCFAQDLVRDIFRVGSALSLEFMDNTQGAATLWSA